MKKTFAILLLLAAAFLICGCDEKNTEIDDTTDINTVEDSAPTDDYPVVIWHDGDIKLCAKSEEARKGANNEKVRLDLGKESVIFEASFSFHVKDSQYYNLDVTGDGTRDHLLILPVNHGTGVYTDCLYVFNGKTLKEIPYDNSLEYLSPIVTFTGNETHYTVSFAAYGKAYPRTLFQSYGTGFEIDAPILDCGFSKFRIEEVGDGKGLIFIDHGVAIGGGNTEFLGECSAFFSYSGDKFVCESFSFMPSGICDVNKEGWDARIYNSDLIIVKGNERFRFDRDSITNLLYASSATVYITNNERYATVVYDGVSSEDDGPKIQYTAILELKSNTVLKIIKTDFDQYLSYHSLESEDISFSSEEENTVINHTLDVKEEGEKLVIYSELYTDDNVIDLHGHYAVSTSDKNDPVYIPDITTVKNPDYEPEILEELKTMTEVPEDLAKTATAFITKDIKALEKLLGTQEGVLRQYRDFEFGSYSFNFKDRTLEMAVEITESSLPDVQPGSYTIEFSEGRYAPVVIDGIGYSRNDLWEGFETEADRYVHNWILCTGLWDFSSVEEINASKDSLYKTGLIMYLKIYGKDKDIDTVEEYEEAANAFFDIDDLHIPDNLIEEDGTVIDNWGWGGPVRTYRSVGGSIDPDTGMLTVRVLTYADFAGTVRSHVYEYKFEDRGDYLKVIYSGIYEESEYEPEDRYVG